MKTSLCKYSLMAALILFLAGCNVTKNLGPGEYLLVKNSVKTSDKTILADDLSDYIQQRPNKKLFSLFRTNIAFYNMGTKGKDTKFKKWLRTKAGSAPVILDTSLNMGSKKQMIAYLNNKGHFNSTVRDSITYRKKKAVVHYFATLSRPYTIHSFNYSITDIALATLVFSDTSNSLVHRGKNYDAYLLDDERTRIFNQLINQGYYHFSTSFISYRVDSTVGNRRLDITLEITNPVVPSLTGLGAVVQSRHRTYKINNIYIYPDFDMSRTDTTVPDTLVKTYMTSYRDRLSSTYYFIFREKFKPKPRTIAQNISIESGMPYSLTAVSKSYTQLGSLQLFKYVNIDFEDVPSTKVTQFQDDLLDCNILLARMPGNGFSVTTDGTNSGGAFGVSGTIGYLNRNIFKGAQLLRISLNGSLQMQAGGGSGQGLFNTIEVGMTSSLTFPQFLLPLSQERIPKNLRPKTVFTIGYNYQDKKDPDFVRHLFNASFGYAWLQNEFLEHTLNPIELLLVKIYPSQDFLETLDSLEDQRIKAKYTDHIVAGLRYTMTYSNQKLKERRNFFFVRANFETGGNLLYAVNSIFETPKNSTDNYTFLGIQYAQFVRPIIDFRYYSLIGKEHSLVSRFYGGIGIPYGNANVLPYEKAFMAGGANDMRGWRMGDLGPGSFHNDTVSQNYGQIGDIQLQANLEYRFPIAGFLKGALYMDIGNIWLLDESVDLPGGKFYGSEFLNQLGIDIGLGIRIDVDFFVFRLDPAIPIRVPYYPSNNHWYFSKLQLSDIIWNFGIGYPF